MMRKPRSPNGLTIHIAELLQRASSSAIRLGRNGTVLVVPLLLGYVLVGSVLSWIGLLALPYPFLSMTADPVFNLLVFVAGIAIALASSGLLVLLLMDGLQGSANQLTILILGISIGSSTAVLRHTHETALSVLIAGVRLALTFLPVG